LWDVDVVTMKALGFLALLVAVLFSLIELSALIDPVGFKGADDNDPFGTPPTWDFHLRAIGLSTVLYYVGYRLTRK
jgi:hypothetical protein